MSAFCGTPFTQHKKYIVLFFLGRDYIYCENYSQVLKLMLVRKSLTWQLRVQAMDEQDGKEEVGGGDEESKRKIYVLTMRTIKREKN